MSKEEHYKAYRTFKSWVEEQKANAETMAEGTDSETLAELLEKNSQSWVQISEMLEDFTLHYQPNGKPKREKRKNNYVIDRKKYLVLLKQLYELYDLAEKVEDFQPLIQKEADKKEFCELWVDLQEGLGYLLAEYNDTLTEKELKYVEGVEEND